MWSWRSRAAAAPASSPCAVSPAELLVAERFAQAGQLRAQLAELTLDPIQPLLLRTGGCGWGWSWSLRRALAAPSQHLLEAVLLLPGLARVADDQLPLEQALQRLLHRREAGEGEETVAALLQLAGRLRPTQHQHRQQRQLFVVESKCLRQQMAILAGATAGPAGEAGPAPLCQAPQRAADRLLVVVDDGAAVGRLVAGEPQRVEREGIGVGRGPLLLDQAADDSNLDCVRLHPQPRSGRSG